MRKTFIIAACGGLFFIAGWAFGQQEKLDSSGWTRLGKVDELARAMYLKGYLDGYNDGDVAMEKVSAILMKGTSPDSSTKAAAAPQMIRVADMLGLGKNHNVTVASTENAITTFYNDYRNAPVCWKDALQLSVWSLNGDTPTEQELVSARKRGAENGCR